MFRTIGRYLLSFDVEWIPDPVSASLAHGREWDGTMRGAAEAVDVFWRAGGATPENPQPFLKTVLCRVVSLCGVFREVDGSGNISLRLVSLPADPFDPLKTNEAAILRGFLRAVGSKKPQLVGYNSAEADIPIIVQRSIAHGLFGEGMGSRPEKPWEGVDYFNHTSDASVDLGPILGRFRQMPSLHEAATVCGIPGKIDVSGGSVPEMWLEGRLDEIVAYNEFDALTTHLLWARVAHFAGLLDAAAYQKEQDEVEKLIVTEIAGGRSHLQRFLDRWHQLRAVAAQR